MTFLQGIARDGGVRVGGHAMGTYVLSARPNAQSCFLGYRGISAMLVKMECHEPTQSNQGEQPLLSLLLAPHSCESAFADLVCVCSRRH